MKNPSKYLKNVFFLTICILFVSSLNLDIQTSDSSNLNKAIVLTQGTLSKNYDYFNQLTSNCKVPNVQNDVENINSRSFYFNNNDNMNSYNMTMNLTYDKDSLFISSSPVLDSTLVISQEILKNSSFQLELFYDCSQNPKFNTTQFPIWTIITMDIKLQSLKETQSFKVSYIKVCQTTNLYKFDGSFIVLAGLSMIVIFFGVRNQRITSFQRKFIGFNINLWMGVLYLVLTLVFLVCWSYFQSVSMVAFLIFMVLLSLFAMIFTLKEFLYYFKIFEICNITLNIPKFPISLMMIFCGVLSLGTVIAWLITSHYFLTDILALFIVFASFKIFKINSLKKGTFCLLLIGFYEILAEMLSNYWSNFLIDVFYSSDYCYPLKFQIPCFSLFLTKRCSWLSVTNLVFPGLFLSYFHRYDSSKKVKIYFLTGYFGYLCGNVLWLLTSLFFAYASPLLFYAFPFMIGFCSLLAYKRNENLELWEGLFYDYDLVFPNIREVKENKEIFEEPKDVFNKQTLFEGLLDSSFDSKESNEDKVEERKVEKELQVLPIIVKDSEPEKQVKSKIKLLEDLKFVPGMSITNKEELNQILKNKSN